MRQIKILKKASHDLLFEGLKSPQRIKQYREEDACNFVSDSDFESLPFSFNNNELKFAMPSVLPSAGTDFENACAIFAYVGKIPRIYAAEPRLWVGLTHGECSKFARWRFPLPVSLGEDADSVSEKNIDHIKSHWFVSGSGLGGLRRNTVARLWWAAYLTVAPWEDDKECEIFKNADRYFFTRILLSSQQVFQDVLEREFGSNIKLRISFLHALNKFKSDDFSIDNLVKRASKLIRLHLDVHHLLTLSIEEIKIACESIVEKAASNLKNKPLKQ